MSKREYDGPALDVSWDDPPWAGDGETVDVITDGGDGDISVEGVDNATKELSDKELVRTIRKLRHEGATYGQISDELGVNNQTIADAAFGRGKYGNIDVGIKPLTPRYEKDSGENTSGREESEVDTSGGEESKVDTSELQGAAKRSLDESDIVELRKELLDGEPLSKFEYIFKLSRDQLARYAKGYAGADPDQPPAIKYDHQHSEWKPIDDVETRHSWGTGPSLDEDDVKAIRQRLIDGEPTDEIAKDYPVHVSTLRTYVRGGRSVDPDNPPALEYSKPDGWVPKTTDGSGTDSSSDAEPEPSGEPDPHEPTSGYAEPPKDPADTGGRFVVGIVVGLAIAKIVRWLTNSGGDRR